LVFSWSHLVFGFKFCNYYFFSDEFYWHLFGILGLESIEFRKTNISRNNMCTLVVREIIDFHYLWNVYDHDNGWWVEWDHIREFKVNPFYLVLHLVLQLLSLMQGTLQLTSPYYDNALTIWFRVRCLFFFLYFLYLGKMFVFLSLLSLLVLGLVSFINFKCGIFNQEMM